MATAWTFIICGLALVVILAPEPIHSANILGFLGNPGRSQFVIHDALMRGLAAKGHNVTVVGVFPAPSKPIPNYKYIKVNIDAKLEAEMETSLRQQVQNSNAFYSFFDMFIQMHRIIVGILADPIVDELKRNSQFDLIVLGYMMNNYQLGLAAHFQCPAVIITGTNIVLPLLDMMGNSLGASHVTHQMISGEQPKTFRQRFLTYIVWASERVTFALLDLFLYQPAYSQLFPPDRYPSLSEVEKNVSLVFFNSHISLGNPMALMPSLIEVSGIQVKKNPDPLPDDVASWLDGAENGVIYFSLGSFAKSKEMSPKKVQLFLNVFGRLKQRVLWKWEGDELPGKPANLMTGAWLPQDDILAHPNVKLFMSHCGLGSVYEAKYHGVPILGLPLGGDQPANAQVIAQDGWSVEMDFVHLTEQKLWSVLQEMLSNGSYQEVVQRKSQLFRDRPEHPLDKATWWVEYVLRHKGAKHMQSVAVHQNWVQFNSVDVIALLLFIVITQLYVSKLILIFAWRRLFKPKSKLE